MVRFASSIAPTTKKLEELQKLRELELKQKAK